MLATTMRVLALFILERRLLQPRAQRTRLSPHAGHHVHHGGVHEDRAHGQVIYQPYRSRAWAQVRAGAQSTVRTFGRFAFHAMKHARPCVRQHHL